MINISDSDKERIKGFIYQNELDFTIVDDDILKFKIISEDMKSH